MEQQSARSIARTWWNSHLEDATTVDIKKLAKVAIAELRNDAAFMESFVDDFMEQALYEQGLRILSNQRALLRTKEGIRRQIDKDAPDIRWATWLEYDPTSGTHVALPDMTREQLLAAAENRRQRAESYRIDYNFLSLLAFRLGEGEKLKDRMTDEDITIARRTVTGKSVYE